MKRETGVMFQMNYSDMDTCQQNSKVAKFQKKRIEISRTQES